MLHRGSEWHKWDLHVHTPASVLNNNFGSDWDNYVTTLFKKAIEHNVSAIGITDYFLLDGYKKLKEDYLNNTGKLEHLFTDDEITKIHDILILPNIEFRLNKFVIGTVTDLEKLNRKPNYHVLFSDETSIEDIQNNFLNQLHFDFDAAIGGKIEKRALNRSNLESFGKKLKSEHESFRLSNETDLYIGMLNAGVDESQIAEVLNTSLFQNQYLLGINPDEDLSKVSWNSQGHNTRKTLIKQSHFAFSSNPNTIAFLSGKFHDNLDDFTSEFGNKKPCLWGSDAHEYDKLFCPDKNRHTWIKSNLTFEGLKQVVYDPDSRVLIQELSPESKKSYQTIKRVRFLDTRTTQNFASSWIPINKDLNTIIGGKSSGKSLLLHHIAKAIHYDEVINNCKISSASTYDEYEKSDNFDFEVEWENGDTSLLSQRSSTKPITYISQLYINHLAESEGRNQLNSLVRDILSQNESFKIFLDDLEQKIADTNQAISQHIGTLYLLKDRYKTITKEISQIGILKSIQQEITSLNTEINKLRKYSGFTPAEEEQYKKITRRLTSLDNRHDLLNEINTYSSHICNSIDQKKNATSVWLQKQVSTELQIPKNSKFVKGIFKHLDENLITAIDETISYTEVKTRNIDALKKKIDIQRTSLAEKLLPLANKVKDQEALNSLQKKLHEEETKVRIIKDKQSKLNSITEQGTETKNIIFSSYKTLHTHYQNISNEIEQSKYQLEEGISIKGNLELNIDKFEEFVSSFDKRGNLKVLLESLINDSNEYVFNCDSHVNTITQIFENLKKPEIPTIRKGISEEDVAKRLFADCYNLNFVVNYNGDEISNMSPGKRGLVLLNLILHLSNASHPILIDQPEDNLDNRTIYNQLKDFIRLRKKDRQIIMVTHNANLVVASDADCIIVANQDGQYVGKDNRNYKFEYCSGSIENTFNLPGEKGLLFQKGIREHICEILEGGVIAFMERERKYGLKQ